MPGSRPLWTPSRRGLLGALAAGGALGALGGLSRLATATALGSADDQHFLFCYFSGGWDVLLGLDPRDPDTFREDRVGDTLIDPGYRLLQGVSDQPLSSAVPGMEFGPYIGDLIDWAPRMALVRGMSMDTLTHEVGRRRFITGKAPAGLQARGSSGAAVLAAQLGVDAPIPNLSSRVESYNVDLPVWATALQVNSVNDLLAVLAPGTAALPPEVADRVAAVLDEFAQCEKTKASRLLSDGLAQRIAAHDLVDQRLDELFDFGANTAEMNDLRARYGFGANQLGSPAAQAAMAATALTAGISKVVSIRVASDLDTHDNWATDHGPSLQAGFDLVAALAADLDSRSYPGGGTWLDHTTIVGFSEFSRTPMINARAGRDHALMNSCFLLGGPIAGGTVIGASSDVGMSPQAIDLASGALDPAGVIVRPENVLRTLLQSIGVVDDIADLRADPIDALLT